MQGNFFFKFAFALSKNCEICRTFAGIGLLADGGFPRQVVEKVITVLAIEALGVVRALALAVHHVRSGQHVGQG